MNAKARSAMPTPRWLRLAGQWTIVAGVLGIVSLVALFVFFAIGPPFGLINDILSIPGLLVLLPAAIVLHQIGREAAAHWSLLALAAMLAGVASGLALQVALIAGVLPFQEQLPLVLVAAALLGFWYAQGTYLARGTLPRGLVRLGVGVGGLFVGATVLFWVGLGLQGGSLGDLTGANAFASLHPLLATGFGLIIVSYALSPAWALWIGRVFLRTGREPPAAGNEVDLAV